MILDKYCIGCTVALTSECSRLQSWYIFFSVYQHVDAMILETLERKGTQKVDVMVVMCAIKNLGKYVSGDKIKSKNWQLDLSAV